MSAAIELWYPDGTRRKWQDDSTRTYTEWDESGNVTLSRPYTAQENAEADQRAQKATAGANESKIRERAAAALATNADFLALAAPTNAQAVAQVQALTKECSALIRLLLRRFESDT